MQKFFSSLIISMSLVWAQIGHAQTALTNTAVESEEPGSGKMAVGKGLALGGLVLGGTLFLVGSFFGVMGDPDPKLSEEERHEKSDRYSRRVALNSTVIALTGVAIGVPLYLVGKNEHDDWKSKEAGRVMLSPRVDIADHRVVGGGIRLRITL